ncbi:hypothetical protein CTI14_63590, partial [Methylobacterium radiotolerans]
EDGVFYAAGRLFGLTFRERADLTGYHEDVRVWEVLDADGSGLGLFLGDYFARPRSGAGVARTASSTRPGGSSASRSGSVRT